MGSAEMKEKRWSSQWITRSVFVHAKVIKRDNRREEAVKMRRGSRDEKWLGFKRGVEWGNINGPNLHPSDFYSSRAG